EKVRRRIGPGQKRSLEDALCAPGSSVVVGVSERCWHSEDSGGERYKNRRPQSTGIAAHPLPPSREIPIPSLGKWQFLPNPLQNAITLLREGRNRPQPCSMCNTG